MMHQHHETSPKRGLTICVAPLGDLPVQHVLLDRKQVMLIGMQAARCLNSQHFLGNKIVFSYLQCVRTARTNIDISAEMTRYIKKQGQVGTPGVLVSLRTMILENRQTSEVTCTNKPYKRLIFR